MRARNPKCIIMSAEYYTESEESNKERTSDLYDLIRDSGMGFKMVVGSYKGVMEQSFLVVYSNDQELALLNNFAKSFQQESILVLDEDRNASLMYCKDRKIEALGRLREVTKEKARELDAYTLTNDAYFTIK